MGEKTFGVEISILNIILKEVIRILTLGMLKYNGSMLCTKDWDESAFPLETGCLLKFET